MGQTWRFHLTTHASYCLFGACRHATSGWLHIYIGSNDPPHHSSYVDFIPPSHGPFPISWRKCELSHTINWIGWRFVLSLDSSWFTRITVRNYWIWFPNFNVLGRFQWKRSNNFLGLMRWITQRFQCLRIWLHYIFRDLHNFPATQYGLDPSQLLDFRNWLNSELIFTSRSPSTAIPTGNQLLETGHRTIQPLQDVRHVFLSDKQLWVRVYDPESSQRKLCEDSLRMRVYYKE